MSDHPGCCGAAARLPKNPGSQKLTPLSSAFALVPKQANIALQTNAVAHLATQYRMRVFADMDPPPQAHRAQTDASCSNRGVFLWRATNKSLLCLFHHISRPWNGIKHLIEIALGLEPKL